MYYQVIVLGDASLPLKMNKGNNIEKTQPL